MSSSNTVIQTDDLSEGEIDDEIGRTILREWAANARWLPDDFGDRTSVESTELIECERRIEREIVVTERTESLELSQTEFIDQKSEFRSPDEYRNRGQHEPQRERWEEWTLMYEVPDTYRETNCSQCSGSGRVPCQNCDSAGKIECESCDGTGQQETKRECMECQGSGWYDEDRGIECRECSGDGQVVVSENCPECHGTGSVSCPECDGSGELTCDTCDGEGVTHKLEVLYRDWEFREAVEHTTNGVPESFLKAAEGARTRIEEAETSADRPEHEIETRAIDVLKVDYVYEDPSLIGGGTELESYTVYYVEGKFEHDEYPESTVRKLLPYAVGAIVLVGILIVLSILFGMV